GTAYSNPILTGKIMERPASIELLYPDATPGLQENGGVRVAGSDFHRPRYAAHGDGSGDWTVATSTSIPEATLASYLKFSLRMYFRSEYGPSKLTWPIFPGDLLQEYDKLVLRGGHNDGQTPFLKDELTRRLFLDMGRVGVQGTLVNLFINGEYKGWYNPCERLDAKFFQARFGGSADYDVLIQDADLGGEIGRGYYGEPYEPQVKEGDDVVFQSLISAAKTNADTPSTANYDAIAALLDIPQFIDYLLVQLYSGNDDWPNNNWTAARERVVGAKFKFFVWDAEATYLSANINRNGIDHFPFWNPTWQSQGAGLKGEFTPISEIYQGLIVSQSFKDAFSARAVEMFTDTTGALSNENVATRYNVLKSEMESLLPGSITFNDHIATTWIPDRESYLIGILQAEGLYPGP
ncbi:MAG: CotH kinase family protein, partial [Candidatus Hydrogenedentota bacterium]